MRTLCLCLRRDAPPSVAEHFLLFSPRVQFREPGFVFVDITSSAALFGGEIALMEHALKVAHVFYPDAVAAIADHPWTAQVFCRENPGCIVLPAADYQQLGQAPLERLADLEGLIPWPPNQIGAVVEFLKTLGLTQLEEIRRFPVDSLRERWGSTGVLIWERLNGLSRQVISPLLPTPSLKDFVHLDFSITLTSLLLHRLEESLARLVSRLQGRGEFAQRIKFRFFCEFSGRQFDLELAPAQPNRNLELLMKLLENKIQEVSLDNPVQDFEIEILACPEKIQQLDLFEPRQADEDKLNQLVSLFQQAQLESGFIKPSDEILPERSWALTNRFEPDEPLQNDIEENTGALLFRPSYSHQLREAPRPSRLFKQPKLLKTKELDRMEFLSTHPIERIEHGWWNTSQGRDYYFAISSQGQFLWLYFDRIREEYYLQGYFD